MLNKKMVSLCRQSETIQIYHTEQGKFICDGHCLYPLYQDADLNSEAICEIYDLNIEKISCRDFQELPEGLDISDFTENETECQILPVSIYENGDVILLIESASGLNFIKKKYLSPLGKYDAGEILIYERYFPNGNKYFVIKIGMELKGIVLPYAVHIESFRKNISYIYDLCKMTKEKSEG